MNCAYRMWIARFVAGNHHFRHIQCISKAWNDSAGKKYKNQTGENFSLFVAQQQNMGEKKIQHKDCVLTLRTKWRRIIYALDIWISRVSRISLMLAPSLVEEKNWSNGMRLALMNTTSSRHDDDKLTERSDNTDEDRIMMREWHERCAHFTFGVNSETLNYTVFMHLSLGA